MTVKNNLETLDETNIGIIATITYFKASGKYYTEEEQSVPFTNSTLIYDIWSWLKINKRLKMNALINLLTHNYNVPHLIFDKEQDE